MLYPSEMGVGDARKAFFQAAGFPADGGYNDRWIKVRFLRFPVWLPNVESRRRAVPLHDLHHILTEYGTTWRGEAEISAWEVSSGGLGHSWAGWILTLMNLAQGLVINPRGIYAAFMRGRQTKNLFGRDFDERILSETVGGVRSSLNLNARLRPPRFGDHMALALWVVVAIGVYLTAVLVPCLPLIATFWILFG